MLPSTPQGRTDYVRYREQRNLHRNLIVESGQDLKARELPILAMEAELSGLREEMDFLQSEGMLTDAQVEAAQNCIAWGDALVKLLPENAR